MWGSLLVIKLYVGESSGYKVICGGGGLLVIKLYVGGSRYRDILENSFYHSWGDNWFTTLVICQNQWEA